MSDETIMRRVRLEALEAGLISLRRSVAQAISGGLEENRAVLEEEIGRVQALVLTLGEARDVSLQACWAHEERFVQKRKSACQSAGRLPE